jgi:hypothetical protein
MGLMCCICVQPSYWHGRGRVCRPPRQNLQLTFRRRPPASPPKLELTARLHQQHFSTDSSRTSFHVILVNIAAITASLCSHRVGTAGCGCFTSSPPPMLGHVATHRSTPRTVFARHGGGSMAMPAISWRMQELSLAPT